VCGKGGRAYLGRSAAGLAIGLPAARAVIAWQSQQRASSRRLGEGRTVERRPEGGCSWSKRQHTAGAALRSGAGEAPTSVCPTRPNPGPLLPHLVAGLQCRVAHVVPPPSKEAFAEARHGSSSLRPDRLGLHPHRFRQRPAPAGCAPLDPNEQPRLQALSTFGLRRCAGYYALSDFCHAITGSPRAGQSRCETRRRFPEVSSTALPHTRRIYCSGLDVWTRVSSPLVGLTSLVIRLSIGRGFCSPSSDPASGDALPFVIFAPSSWIRLHLRAVEHARPSLGAEQARQGIVVVSSVLQQPVSLNQIAVDQQPPRRTHPLH